MSTERGDFVLPGDPGLDFDGYPVGTESPNGDSGNWAEVDRQVMAELRRAINAGEVEAPEGYNKRTGA